MKNCFFSNGIFDMRFLFLVGLVASVVTQGCCPLRDPASVLRHEAAARGITFTRLDPVTIDILEDHEKREHALIAHVVRGLTNAFPKDPNIAKYAEGLRKSSDVLHEGHKQRLGILRTGFDPKHDRVFVYSYTCADSLEDGWLVASRGRIKIKVPLATTSLDR